MAYENRFLAMESKKVHWSGFVMYWPFVKEFVLIGIPVGLNLAILRIKKSIKKKSQPEKADLPQTL